MAISKRYKKAVDNLDRNKSYTVEEAVKLIKARATAKFDETIELSLNLGVDPKHADQMVRGVVSLPSGSGRSLRVAVFAKGAKAEEARKAGADSASRSSTARTAKTCGPVSSFRDGTARPAATARGKWTRALV